MIKGKFCKLPDICTHRYKFFLLRPLWNCKSFTVKKNYFKCPKYAIYYKVGGMPYFQNSAFTVNFNSQSFKNLHAFSSDKAPKFEY